MVIGGILSLVFLVWMLFKIAKQSVLLAILCFFFWPALIFALFKYWGEEESDIKLPFALWVASTAYAWYDMAQMARSLKDEQESLLGLMRLLA